MDAAAAGRVGRSVTRTMLHRTDAACSLAMLSAVLPFSLFSISSSPAKASPDSTWSRRRSVQTAVHRRLSTWPPISARAYTAGRKARRGAPRPARRHAPARPDGR